MKTASLHKGIKLAMTTVALGLALLLPWLTTAQTITDSFTNLADWGAPFTESGKNLSVASGRLNFTSADISGGTAAIPRTTPLLTTTQHWSVQVDAHLDNFTITSAEQSVSLFLGVGKTGDWFDTHVLLGFDRDDHFPDSFGMNDDFSVNGSSINGFFNVNGMPSGDVAMRLDYNATAQTLTFSYDANGAAGGYSWTQLGITNIASGPYNLQFGPSDTFTILLAGWANLQTVASGQAYFDNLEINILPQTGSLQVTINPSNAVSAGAQWQVDGGAWQNHSNVVTGLSVGNHTVAYQAISGWIAPGNQTVAIVANTTTVTNGTYVPETGSLQVTISPAGAVSAGAQWQVDGGAWQNSGATVSGLTIGNHTVTYKIVSGWIAPGNQMVPVATSTTTVTNGAYSATVFNYVINGGAVTVTGYTGPGGAITIPGTIGGLPVTSIGDAFIGPFAPVTSVTMPDSVTNIGVQAFQFNSSLTNVFFGNGLTHIGSYAFEFCLNLKDVIIPSTVVSIGNNAFAICPSLSGIYFRGNAPNLGGADVFYDSINTTVYYLPGMMGWAATYGGRPTALWQPRVLTATTSLGVQSNQFGFSVTWASGQTIVTEAATNLTNPTWVPLKTNTLTSDSIYFSDPQWTNFSGRFYRIRSP